MERKLTILYGSQTGTAQDLAEDIWRESKRFFFKGCVSSMEDYPVQNLIKENIVIFVCSTTGQGDEPDNMKSFWKFLLKKSLPVDSLISVKYAVLGLGDSSYTKFNFVAKKLNKRLTQLGGFCLLPVGLADDQHDLGPSAVTTPWISALWEKLSSLYPLPDNLEPLSITPRSFRWNVNILENKEITQNISSLDDDIFYANSNSHDNFFKTTVVNNTRTTSPSHFQDVRLISFLRDSIEYDLGDVLYVRPHNNPENVRHLFQMFEENNLNFTPETIVMVTQIDNELPVPSYLSKPITLLSLATYVWDLSARPRARAFKQLYYAFMRNTVDRNKNSFDFNSLSLTNDEELERDKLKELSEPEGLQSLYDYVYRPKRSILEVLHDFPHAASKLTIQAMFEIFETIKPRAFSIASRPGSDTLDILVAVVQYRTILKMPRLGLCSNWLSSLKTGDRVWLWCKKGTMKFPKDLKTHLILVGPGTGLAPFRNVLLWREYHLQKLLQDFNSLVDIDVFEYISESLLFFGCRGKEKDFHCRDDLERLNKKKIVNLFCAFSRDQEDKIYVQHLIEKQSKLICKLLENGAQIYVSGNSKNMPQAVKESFGNIYGEENINRMIKNCKYQEETWS